jgi:nucleoid DNA-binding protein
LVAETAKFRVAIGWAGNRIHAKMAGSPKGGDWLFQRYFEPSHGNRILGAKADIIRVLVEEFGLSRLQSAHVVRKTLDGIVQALVEEGRVELRNFGIFEVRWRKPRKARNPRTGEMVMVPTRCSVIFKPGLVMQDRVATECRSCGTPAE